MADTPRVLVVRLDPHIEHIDMLCPYCWLPAVDRITLNLLAPTGVTTIATVHRCADCGWAKPAARR